MRIHFSPETTLAIVALVLLPATALAQVNTIFGNANPVPGVKWEIAVLADGYTSSAQFDLDASNLIVHDWMADPFYASLGQHFLIKTVFQASPSSNSSLFGIKITGGVSNCYIQTQPDTDTKIFDAMHANVPSATHVMVLKNDTSTIGCTEHGWTVVSSGNVNTTGTLQHEFGHQLAGLHDEYVIDPNSPYPTPPVNGPNCATDLTKAWWNAFTAPSGISAPVNRPGCKYYGLNIWRPYDTCRMRKPTVDFCPVCKAEMIVAAYGVTLPEPPVSRTTSPPHRRVEAAAPRIVRAAFEMQPPSPDSSVRVVVALTRGTPGQFTRAHVLTAADVAAPAPKMYRRTGDYVYEIKEGNATKETGFLTGDPFEERAYGTKSAPHGTTPSRTANVVISIPESTKAGLASRNVQINVYWLRGVDERISMDRATFERFRSSLLPIASVPVDDLHDALKK